MTIIDYKAFRRPIIIDLFIIPCRLRERDAEKNKKEMNASISGIWVARVLLYCYYSVSRYIFTYYSRPT